MKNQLLYYQGGGYGGCIWEWNFCFWDGDGVWHNLFASGCSGAETEQAALKIAETLKHSAELVDLADPDRFKQFQQDNNAGLVLHIAQELNENYNYALEIVCTGCGCSNTADYYEYQAVIDNSTIVCAECLSTGTCDCCNEYVGDTKLHWGDEDGMVTGMGQDYTDDKTAIELVDLGYYQVCSGCFEYNKEEIRLRDLKDLRFQAFCTGEPDIFSEKLRDYWS